MYAKNTRKRKQRQYDNLINKYKALFLNLLEFEGMDYGVKSYFMNKLLYKGKIAAFKLNGSNQVESELGFGDYSIREWDWKNKPIWIKPLNEHRNRRVPQKWLRNDKEAVLLELDFIPYSFISEYVERIMDIEATIRFNLNAHKMPFIIKSADNKTINAIKSLFNNDEFIWTDNIQMEILDNDVPYIIDKLQLYKSEIEAELLSVLGIDNVKFEKKAQMSVDEVNSNADEIDAYRAIIREKVEAFFEQINKVLGFNITVKEDDDEMYVKGEMLDDQY